MKDVLTQAAPVALSLYQEMQQTDWLSRNSKHYTHRKGKSEWEQRVTKGQPYSSAFFKPARSLSFGQKLIQTRQQCMGVVQGLTLPGKRPVRVQFGAGATGFTDSKTFIELTTEPLGDKSVCKSFGHALDVILGLTVHEMAHVLYTDTGPLPAKLTGKSRGQQSLYKWLENLIEDERIERLVGNTHPGYLNFVGQTKYYVFEQLLAGELQKLAQEVADGKKPPEITTMMQVQGCLLNIIRYPKSLNEHDTDVHEDVLRGCMEDLTPYPRTYPDVLEATDKVYARLLAYYEEAADDENWDLGQGTFDDYMESLLKILLAVFGKGDLSNTKQVEAEMDAGPGSYEQQQVQQAIQQLNAMDDKQVEARKDAADDMHYEAGLQTGFAPVEFVDKSKPSLAEEEEYRNTLPAVANLSANLRAELRKFNRAFSERVVGLDEGNLNEDDIVQARLGSKNVYEMQRRVSNNGATIILLIDESGSMGGAKIKRARQIAVLFEQALRGLNGIDYYCYGHTTGYQGAIGGNEGSTVLNVYFEGFKRGKATCLGGIEALGGNRDGHAILQVGARVRQKTPLPAVMFMISDGEPSASVPAGYDGRSYCYHAQKELRKKGIEVIHIAIDKVRNVETMFDRSVKFTDLNTLAKDLGQLMRTVVAKIQQPTEVLED